MISILQIAELFNMYSEFFLVSCAWRLCIDAANACERGRDYDGGRADGKQGKAYGIAKSKDKDDERSHKENA
jgi:hypothetical protein